VRNPHPLEEGEKRSEEGKGGGSAVLHPINNAHQKKEDEEDFLWVAGGPILQDESENGELRRPQRLNLPEVSSLSSSS